jgi:prefoldin subunit 5
VLNFRKRELLIGRTHTLESSFVEVARTIEAQDPPETAQPALPQRDTAPVSSRTLDNPEMSAFWDSYNHKLEPSSQAIPMLDFGTQEALLQLKNYYRLGPDGKPEIDPVRGAPATDGKGTMKELLEKAHKRAIAQYDALIKTRAELLKLRQELCTTIEDLNAVKKEGRKDKKTIEELNARISQLEGEKRDLEKKIERLEQEKTELKGELAEAKGEIDKQKEAIETLDKQIADLKKKLDVAVGKGGGGGQGAVAAPGNLENVFTPGEKGTVAAINEAWKFAVVQLSDAFMLELLGKDRNQPMPQIEMNIRRPGLQGPAGDFVTRIRLRQVIRDQNLIVADVLSDWQQAPVEKGDVVYF